MYSLQWYHKNVQGIMYCVLLLLHVNLRQYFNLQNTQLSVVGLAITITKFICYVFTYVFVYGLMNNYVYLRKYSVQDQEDKIIVKDVKANDPGML
jgi:hypothetical protein